MIPPLLALPGVARAPRRALSSGECDFHSFDPPRGRPLLVRRQSSFVGVWGLSAPMVPLPHNPDLPARPEDFRKSLHHEPEDSGNYPARAAQDFQEKSGPRSGNFQKRSTPPPTSKKIGRPPTPTSRSEKKIDRSDRFQNRAGRSLLFQCHNMRFHWIL